MRKSSRFLTVLGLAVLFPIMSFADENKSGLLEFGRNADRWETRIGSAFYDSGPFSSQIFSGGVINGEFLAPSPDFLSGIGSPRPYVGTDISLSDEAIYVLYAGLGWEAYLTQRLYLGFGAGGSINSDKSKANDFGEVKDLGSQVLFHLQASVGFDITPNLTAQVYLNHFSNANLADSNDGLESTGLRIGMRF
jgi:lipid A 3-O-deacylase